MNVFNFVDEAIRGAIQFIFGFFHTTFVLYTRPLTGAKRLYLRAKAPMVEQISSPTYLAICILFATPFLLSLANSLNLPLSSFFAGLAREIVTGDKGGLGPLVGGTIAGTILLSAILRLVAWRAGLKSRKRERMIVTGEYQFGLLVLGLAAAVYVMNFYDPGATEEWLARRLGDSAITTTVQFVVPMAWGYLLGMALAVALFVPTFTASIGLWSAVSRNPRALALAHAYLKNGRAARKALKLAKTSGGRRARKAELARLKKRQREMYRRLLGLRPNQRLTFSRRARGMGRLAVGYAGMLASILLAGLAVGGGAYATSWLLNRETGPDVELLGLSCRIEKTGPTASAVAWNRSDRPKLGWNASAFELRIYAADPAMLQEMKGFDAPYFNASWKAARTDGAPSDLLAAKHTVALEGPLALPEAMPAEEREYLLAREAFACELAPSAHVAAAD